MKSYFKLFALLMTMVTMLFSGSAIVTASGTGQGQGQGPGQGQGQEQALALEPVLERGRVPEQEEPPPVQEPGRPIREQMAARAAAARRAARAGRLPGYLWRCHFAGAGDELCLARAHVGMKRIRALPLLVACGSEGSDLPSYEPPDPPSCHRFCGEWIQVTEKHRVHDEATRRGILYLRDIPSEPTLDLWLEAGNWTYTFDGYWDYEPTTNAVFLMIEEDDITWADGDVFFVSYTPIVKLEP